jgi:hypothetical protein
VKIGSENRTKVIAASLLGALALFQLVRMLWPSGGAEVPVSASVPVSSSSSSSGSGSRSTESKASAKLIASADTSLDPTLRLHFLHAVESINYGGSGRNIFVEQPDAPPIPVPTQSVVTDPGPPVPQGPPPPPPITLKFFGFANKTGESKKVFLSEGDDVFIAAEGDIVNRRYKVVHISPNAVEIEDVLYNHTQSIPLTQS